MEELWRSGEAPVRAVMDALNKGTGKKRAYTTYMTIMARLHKKGMLIRRREGKTDFYAPSYDREQYMALRARAQVEDLVAQYGDVALEQLRSADGQPGPGPPPSPAATGSKHLTRGPGAHRRLTRETPAADARSVRGRSPPISARHQGPLRWSLTHSSTTSSVIAPVR